MQSALSFVLAFGLALGAQGSTLASLKENPIPRVLTLLHDLQAKIHSDAQSEQDSYDKYACWCEDTLGQKATDISEAKEHLDKLQELIYKLKGNLGSHRAEIKQLEKDIASNTAAMKEAEALRQQERQAYREEKTQSEQCIGALEAAINVLSSHQSSLLASSHEAQLLSVAADIKSVIIASRTSSAVSSSDMEVIRRFISRPEDFVGRRTANFMSSAQIKSPYGDYAPASTQIQGILKQMYDGFAQDLEKANAEEAMKQKGFLELMGTKKMELKTLETTLGKQKKDEADKTKDLADSVQDRDDTGAQLQSDEEFFKSTKTACSDKAAMWSERTRLRTEELHGIIQAITILSSEEATATFANATSTFLQLSSGTRRAVRSDDVQSDRTHKAYSRLSALAGKYNSIELARLASEARVSNGRFDAVLQAIDKMMARLRQMEQSDIQERDLCDNMIDKNKVTIEDLNNDILKATNGISRLADEITELNVEIGDHQKKLNGTEMEVDELRSLRLDAQYRFAQAVKADDEAVGLLTLAIAALSKFYAENGAALVQGRKQDPAPDTNFDAEHSGENQGIVSMLNMIKEDLEKEIATARKEDAEAQAQYEEDLGGLNSIILALSETIANAEKVKAAKEQESADLDEKKALKETDLTSENGLKAALETKCAWVETHFDSRRENRKAEMDGLNEARSFLAGANID